LKDTASQRETPEESWLAAKTLQTAAVLTDAA